MHALVSPMPVFGMKVIHAKSVIWLFLTTNQSMTTLIESSQRDFFIEMVVQTLSLKIT